MLTFLLFLLRSHLEKAMIVHKEKFIEELAKINGIDLELIQVEKMDIIIASHESINGDNQKLIELFKENSKQMRKEEQLKYINMYCSDCLKKLFIDNT